MNLGSGHRAVVGKVKTGAIGIDQRTLLLHMLTQHFAQGFVHQVGSAVVALGGGTQRRVDMGSDAVADLQCAGGQGAMVAKHIGLDFLGVTHFKQRVVTEDGAFVADLAAALAVKRRAVQHHHPGLTGF